ncbi:hypothetical protein H8356DRAFT_936587, partial [Neocallimastix lanati (nom. inval.)]
LENKSYNPEKDISLLISDLNMLFKELDDPNHSLSNKQKFNYLYASFSKELAV